MRKTKILTVLSVLLLVMLACNFALPGPTDQQPTPIPQLTVITEPTSSPRTDLPRDENAVPRVSLEQALTALNSGAAIFVDVRSQQSYDQNHIAGAISIPLAEIETNPTGIDLPKDQWIITYCT